MMKQLLIVRHCEAVGQAADAPLSDRGIIQARALADALPRGCVNRIICSPYLRAIQSITPFANRHDLSIESDERLRERTLGAPDSIDWRKALADSFDDFDLTFPDGESNRAAMARGVAVLNELAGESRTMIVTHGNLMTLLLRSFDPTVGFAHWSKLTNPDVYRVTLGPGGSIVDRITIPI